MAHTNSSFKKIGTTYGSQKELLNESDHDEVFEDTWESQKDGWLDYVKNEVPSTNFSYARYCRDMEQTTGFCMKNNLTLPSLGWKNFNSLRDESNEPIYPYKNKKMRCSVRQSLEEVGALRLINNINLKKCKIFWKPYSKC